VSSVLGAPVAGGGRHDGIGTENRIVPLDEAFVEVLAVVDPAEAARTALGRALRDRIAAAGEGLMAWVVRVEDLDPVAARLGLARTEVTRAGGGAVLLGLPEALETPALPIFVERPAGRRPAGAGGPGIDWIEVRGDERRLRSWLGDGKLPVRVVAGDPAVLRVGVGGRILS
jgi:hypothetical protein